jgi:hypothetical protein
MDCIRRRIRSPQFLMGEKGAPFSTWQRKIEVGRGPSELSQGSERGNVQKIFRCQKCQRGMRVVGATGLGREVERALTCPYCKTKNKVMWPRGDPFRVQRIATR